MPPGSDATNLLQLRTCIERAIIEAVKTASDAGGECIVAGDFNATLQPQDRSSRNTYKADEQHAAFVTNCRLKPLEPCGTTCRPPTYVRDPTAPEETPSSRIDDILTTSVTAAMRSAVTVLPPTATSDHRPLLARIEAASMRLVLPTETQPQTDSAAKSGAPILVRPISNSDQNRFRDSVSAGPVAQQIYDLWSKVEDLYSSHMIPHMRGKSDECGKTVLTLQKLEGRPAAEVVHEVCTQLVDTMAACMEVALQVCATKPSGRPKRYMQPRRVGRRRKALALQYRAVIEMQQLVAQDGYNRSASTLGDLTPYLSDPTAGKQVAARLASTALPASHALQEEGKRLKMEMKQSDAMHRQACKAADAKTQRQLWRSHPKRAHRQIFNPEQQPEGALEALMDGDTVTMDPTRLVELAHEYYSKLLTAPKPKASSLSALLRASTTEKKVWERDGMKLETRATRLNRRPWLHAAIADEKEFYACMGALANGKATGVDGIPAELLRILPEPLKQATHKCFLLMWLTGVIPNSWKESETCLLYKGKGSQLSLKFYRPITLERALYKAFTALATRVISDYAEEHGIMCEGQAGGRRFRNTTQVVDMLIMACEDARAFKKDLFVLMIDFTAAFNTIDQDDMLAIMYDMGIPCDALSVIHAMYTEATTVVALPAGRTAPIPVQRGTLQGNTMSPLLFNLYMSPLIRWLQFGAMGYKFGCLENDQPALAVRAFLDDLTCFTNSISTLHAQAEKVTLYGNRYHIDTNAEKSVVTAALHARAEGHKEMCRAAKNALVNASNAATQEAANIAAGTPSAPLKSVVELQGRMVTYVPPTQPFKLLGVHMTMTLNWDHARRTMADTLAEKLKHLGASLLTPSQKLRVLETNVRPALAYHMAVTPCAPFFLDKLDRMMGRFVKKTLGLAQSIPTAMLREEYTEFGIGCPSLTAEYASAAAKGLVDALQDPTLRGRATRALLTDQMACLAGLDPHTCGNELNYCLRARQLSVLHKSDMALRLKGTEQFPPMASELWAKTETQLARLKSVPALHRLIRLPGVTDMRQLLNARGTHVLSGKELALLTGRTLPRAARVALARLTTALCCDGGACPPNNKRHMDLPMACRAVLPQWRADGRRPTYPQAKQTGVRQWMIDECFALLTTMGKTASTQPDGPRQPQPAPAPSTTRDAPDSDEQPLDEKQNSATETAMEVDSTAPAKGTSAPEQHGNKRQCKDWHRAPCAPRPARTDETRVEMTLLVLHHPPDTPVTGGELATTLTRANLANRMENQLLKRLTKRERGSAPHIQTVAGKVACALYNNNLVVEAVHASRLVKAPRKHKRDTATRPAQLQMLVEWRPTLIDAWARPLVERAGYTVRTVTPLSRAELHTSPSHPLRDQVQCELCCGHHSGAHDLWWCDGCHKRYHGACLGLPPQQPPATEWQCPACKDPTHEQYEAADHDLLLVEWGREWHPLGNNMQQPAACFDSPEGRTALAVWAQARDAPAEAPRVAADAGKPNITRQQPEDAPGTWNTTRGSKLRGKLHLQVAPINPQADITPPGTHTIVIRDVDTWQGEGEPHGRHTLACTYDPSGRLVGTLGVDTLAGLKQRYDSAARQGKHNNICPPVGTFEREVAELICRYRDGQKFKSANTGKPREVRWGESPSAPRYLLDGLVQTLGITKERFASPLDVHHSIIHYNSAHPRDVVFDADTDAYTSIWTGWSWCHPPHCPSALDKAVAWAAASARAAQEQGTPSATLMLLPRVGTAPPHVQRLGLNADVSTHLGTIQGARGLGRAAACMRLLPAGWWLGGPAHRVEKTKDDMDLVIIWNEIARSDTDRHAAAVAAAVYLHGPPDLRLSAPPPQPPEAGWRAQQWLGRLLMDTVRVAVGDMNGIKRQHDLPGGPSQGMETLATLPSPLHGDDELQLGHRAVSTWLGTLSDEAGQQEPPLQWVYGGDNWGIHNWSLHWKPKQGGEQATHEFPRHFGKARASPEARHWGTDTLRVRTTGWMGRRDAVRPHVAGAMQAWGTAEHAARHPLRWDWRDMAYTDGSLLKPAGKDTAPGSIGAAVYVPSKGDRAANTHLVAPGGEGPSWTISRAELAAIWAALSKGYTTICTDSLASIWLIQAAACDPMRLRRHKHRPLLEAIVSLIDSAGGPVTIAKVAAHQGLGAMGAIGNNEADSAAKRAARNNEACDTQCALASHGFHDQVWITARTKRPDGTHKTEYVGNMRSDLTKRMRGIHRLGVADPAKSLYASLWQKTTQTALRAASNAFASDPHVTHAQRRIVWAYRTGTLFNRKLEQRWFKTGDGLCPLCKQPDGGGHIAGGCLDPRMRGMYTSRHNAIARVLLKAVAKSNRGAELCGADVGSAEDMRAAGLGHLCAHRHIPRSMLPPGCASAPSRPDAWMIRRGHSTSGLGWMNTHGAESKPLNSREDTWITLIEIKMCPDTDPTKQQAQAEEQHASLDALLTKSLNGKGAVTRKTILVGHSGTVYDTDSLKALMSLGVQRSQALKTLGKAHRLACQHLHSIVGVRRHLEPPRYKQGHRKAAHPP